MHGRSRTIKAPKAAFPVLCPAILQVWPWSSYTMVIWELVRKANNEAPPDNYLIIEVMRAWHELKVFKPFKVLEG